MRNNLAKKYSVLGVLAIYVLAYFLQSLSFFDFGLILDRTYAENQLDYTNLVAVFVDDKIYDDIKEDIKRYAQTYIQGEDSNNRYNSISNSKAIVIPIDIEKVSAPEITKILENMYFDGVSNEISKLVGTVLIGDIPLPVVNQDGFIYPTIYPYVDFEEQKFIWNEKQNYFVYNDNPDGKAEIWHGIINFDNISSYNKYFEKLKNYSDEPSGFIGKRIWYDDLIANKQYFYKEALGSYINNFLFAEDIGNRRYTDLMVKLMQGSHNDMISELLEGFDGMDELTAATEEMNTPTMTLKKMIDDGYLKTYTSLIGPKQLDNIVTNVETANRWTEQYTGSDGEVKTHTALDTHYMKMELKDETLLRMNGGLDPLITTFNNVLEDILNDKIEEEKYWMNEVIPLTYLRYDGDKKISPFRRWKLKYMRKTYSAFENYFFGTQAKNITSMKETSTYRGTYRNLDNISGLTVDDIQNSEYPASDISDEIDLNKKSVGGSYDIFATQVDANRGFNINNTVSELETYDALKIAKRSLWTAECNVEFWGICWSRRTWRASTQEGEECIPGDEERQGGCELPGEFAVRNRGGASPLNLSGMNDRQNGYNFQDAIMPIFDIAGSKEISTGEIEANSFEGVNKYSRLIQKTFVPTSNHYRSKNDSRKPPAPFGKGYDSSLGEIMKFTNWIPSPPFTSPNRAYTSPKLASNTDYFSKFNNNTHWEGDIIKTKNQFDNDYKGNGEIYTYRTLDSRIWNDLTTKDQIGGIGFKIFQDPKSPAKILNEGINDKLVNLDEEIEPNIELLDINNSSGVMYNIKKIGDHITNINNSINSIISYPISNLNSLSTVQIQTLANNWENSFKEQDLINISGDVTKIQDQFMDIDNFVENFGYSQLNDYLETQFYNFDLNNWKLIFYNTWKSNILTDLNQIKSKYQLIGTKLDETKIVYNSIPDIQFPVTALVNKIAAINLASLNSSGNAIGCLTTYSELCGAITNLQLHLTQYRGDTNDRIDEIPEIDEDLNGSIDITPFVSTVNKINTPAFTIQHNSILNKINSIEDSDDLDLIEEVEGMNLTTSDRPIDSPKYITFKGIGGDKVNFVYPNIYKAEVFSGTNILNLRSTAEIANAIRYYLRKKVEKYNTVLQEEAGKRQNFYNQNATAYNLLATQDKLASPYYIGDNNRPYELMSPDFLIKELEDRMNNSSFFVGKMDGLNPIDFIAHMIYYQNIGRQQREIGDTIQEDMDNIREEFDVNNKISHIVDNYLIKGNNRGDFITPGYRDDGYEVAFINSDGSDYIDYKDEPAFIQRVNAAKNSFKKKTMPPAEQSNLEEELLNNCNIPEDGGVMLFDLQNGGSPWVDALACWREQIKTKPIAFEFDWSSVQGPPISLGEEGDSVGEIIADNLGADDIQAQYMNQLDLLDTDDENQEVLDNLDNSNPGDYAKLEKIISYTKIEINNQNINADTASGTINISSSKQLGDVKFHVENVGDSPFIFDEEEFTLDPFDTKTLDFKIENPVDGINVLMFHMCLPGTQNLDNCVKKSLRINVIPGAISNISINAPGNKILKGAKLPISVIGVDSDGNSVGQLVSQKFTISTSTGSLSYKSATNSEIKFSDFDNANFVLNADDTTNGTEIKINVDGYIGDNNGTHASIPIQVVKGDIDLEYNDTAISHKDQIDIDLTSTNEYAYKDSFNLNQINLNTIPSIKLKLVDDSGDAINIENIVKVSSKNGLIKPGEIETRMVTKNQNNMTFEVEQNRFKGENNHLISNGEVTVYLMPSFKAGEDILYISMPGIDAIELPVIVNPAPASMIELNTRKSEIAKNSNTDASIKVMDIWGNIITQDTVIKLGTIGPINISGFNSSSSLINVQGGEYNFDINSQNQGGAGFVYAMINNLALEEQKPGNATVTVQNRILPDEDLNLMYLNLFGSDWGNQRGYMSENNKYIEDLIDKSEKLLTTTTQLVTPDKIKKFSAITDYKLQIDNIEDKEINLNLLNGTEGKIEIEIEDIGKIMADTETFKLKEVDVSDENIETVLSELIDDYDDDNILIYLPEDNDSIIESNEIDNNSIYINGDNVFNLDNATSDNKINIKLNTETTIIDGYQVWDVKLSDKKIGRLLISAQNNDNNLINISLSVSEPKYDYNTVWLNGSTNNNGIGFYEIESNLSYKTMGYDSIQNSIDPTIGLGFRSDFKNITNFGAGESVGDATLPFSSEFLINIGDPLLKRINENESTKTYDVDGNLDTDTGFDKGLGEVVYSEPGKTILKVIDIDFNNDGLEDIIVAFTDGTVKILKNYGGNQPFEQLGDLMILADGIKEIIVGDVDGNDYEDIIIWSKGDTLRVYKNDEGVFDVDGYPICININTKDGIASEKPQDISGIFQIFFEDMNQDGSLDIVANDKLGYIKIFYGGTNNPENLDNYVSTDKYKCDDQWFERINYGYDTSNPNTKMAYRFGIRINENIKVIDQSRVHRQGINSDDNVNITAEDLGVDTSMFSPENMENLDPEDMDDVLAEAMNFDVGAAEEGFMVAERYKPGNFGKIPVYEDIGTGTEADIEYVEIGCLTGSDPIDIYKKFEDINGDVLENGDTVKISINIKANENFVGTFIDRITGPWKISLLEDGMIEHFWFDTGSISQDTIENELKFHRDMVNARYMIDNIKLSAGEEMNINYWVTYDGDVQTNKIEIADVNGLDYERGGNGQTGDFITDYPQDNYPDIKIKPSDGCNKSMFVLFNEDQDKDYAPEYIDLTEIMMAYSAENQANYDNAMSDIGNTLSDNAADSSEPPDMSEIPGLGDMLESWDTTDILGDSFDIDTIISQGGVDLSNIGNAPSQLLDSLLGDTMDKVDELMGGLCDGFDLSEMGIGGGGCGGLPVPFNQGFLGPGDYHVFGCYKIDPLTETLGKGRPVLNIPGNWSTPAGILPFPGLFGLPLRGINDGFLGGPKGGSYDSQFRLYLVPTLTAELGIAMCFGPYTVGDAIPDPASSIGGNCVVVSVALPCKNKGGLGPNASNTIPPAFLDLETCTNQNKPCYVGPGESISSLEMVSSSSASSNMTSAVPDGSFAGGFINIEKDPVTTHGYNTHESGISIDGVDLFGGADADNKILGGAAQGLIKKLAKNWMDKQINYIVSNLTNFKVDVYWPDFGGMMGGMGNGGLAKALETEKIKDCYKQEGMRIKNLETEKPYCYTSPKQKCENKGKKWKSDNISKIKNIFRGYGDNREKDRLSEEQGNCIKKPNPSQNDDAFAKIDSLAQNSLLDRGQITNLQNTSFANPFEKIEAMFEEVPLINLRTENITVKVPMISSEDITAYISMSRNWIKTQQKILKEWLDLLKAMVGWCGGKKDIESFSDLKDAVKELKEQMKADLKDQLKGEQEDIDNIKDRLKSISDPKERAKLEKEQEDLEKTKGETEQKIASIAKKITAINDLNKGYDLNYLGDYEIYESCDGGNFIIQSMPNHSIEGIFPDNIYLVYDPANEEPLTMFSKGFDLIKKERKNKIVISYEKNGSGTDDTTPCLKSFVESKSNQCMDLFLGGKFDLTLKNFLNIQASTDGLINSVRQNIETLELYKKFPLDLYEWIHVGDRYMSEISSIINNFLGTLSLWMKTNATRYSQYVDSLIMIMTTIQTYQAIIDLSVNWSEKCSSCTNDNYDQFACKLSLICPDNLPIFKIPPMKIPSIYIDLSHMNLATDIKLPKFNFVPTTVALPSLPNIPSPPEIDLSLSMEDSLSLGLSIIEGLMTKLDNINLGLNIPSIPVIPSPPDLPKIPSFLPSVKMELPLLPPAPKIPKLPNEISAAIDAAEVIGQILCIVKGNIGLVGEASIKAKVEQMTQRDYEVPFWDNLDQTLSEWNTEADGNAKIPGWISNTFGFLKSNEFQDVELKGFDLGIESYVNLQYDFAGFYDFIDQVVGEVNKYSGMPAEFMQEQVDNLDEKSRALEAQMSACTTNPISQKCMGDAYTGAIKETKERSEKTMDQINTMQNFIENGFDGVKEATQIIAREENKRESILEENEVIDRSNTMIESKIDSYNSDLEITTDDFRIKEIEKNIDNFTKDRDNNKILIEQNNIKIEKLDKEIESLNDKYGASIESYETYLSTYADLLGEYNTVKEQLSERGSAALDAVNKGLGEGGDAINDALNFEKMDERNKKMQVKMDKFDAEQSIRREMRDSGLGDLKKDVNVPEGYGDGISYVDFDEEIYQKNIKILQDSLNNIKDSTNNPSFKKEIDEYLKLSNIDNNISPATDGIKNIERQYTKIVRDYREQNKLISDTIGDDYDKFLYAVSQNNVTLVGNDELDISLSSNLFDIDKNSLSLIKEQDNLNKTYLDYNTKNIDGYINAIESNNAEQLSMTTDQYNDNKKYLYELKDKTNLAYRVLGENNLDNTTTHKDRKILAQNNGGSSNGGVEGGEFTDISSYINGKVIKTPGGSIDLANDKYVKDFQGKSLMTDINADGANDLLLRDRNNLYIKYRNGNNSYDNEEYINKYYVYHISSYNNLIDDSDEGFVKIDDIYLKMCDLDWEVKNFRYNGGNFDSIKVAWMNSQSMGDKPAGYLIKMIHRVDLFNDKESIVSNSNEDLFDKKYILALPKGAPLTGTKITLEEGTYRTKDILSGLIFDTMEYNENLDDINLTIQDIPRNWQYSEIYTLDLYEDSLYFINNTSSNQIVAGPQIIADTKGPVPEVTLYRPTINTVIDTGENFEGYVSTNYILQSNWEDNVSIDKLRIADEQGNNILNIDSVNEKTGYIELEGLFFTGAGAMNYYFGATDINGNSEVTQVTLKIKIPKIEIIDIQKYGNEIENIGSPATITAEIEHDLDEGYVKFNRFRNDIRQLLTGTVGGINIDKYDLEPHQTIITGGYYDFGDDIGLYLPNGELAVKINPNNGKIYILDGFEDLVNIQLDYSTKRPMIKVSQSNGDVLFVLSLPVEKLIDISSSSMEIENLEGEVFGDFNGGKAIIKDDEVWIYVGPNGEIYAEGTVYGDYLFDDATQTVQYSFKQNPSGNDLGYIKIKIKNLLGE